MEGLVWLAVVIGIIMAVLYVINFVVMLIVSLINAAITLIVAAIIYAVCGIYVGLDFIATNVFVGLDKIFYPGFDVPPIAVWIFWGLVIGVAIQGAREMKIYGRKGMQVLIGLSPVMLLAIVNLIKTLVL
jgi:hypothetical protein